MRNIDQWKRVLDKKIPKIYGAIVSGVLLVLLLMFSICVNLDETLIAVSLIAVLAIFLRQIEFDQKIIQIRNVPIILFWLLLWCDIRIAAFLNQLLDKRVILV